MGNPSPDFVPPVSCAHASITSQLRHELLQTRASHAIWGACIGRHRFYIIVLFILIIKPIINFYLVYIMKIVSIN